MNEETITGKFCVSDQQRLGEYEGVYRDYDYTLWKWQCKQPDPSVVPDSKNNEIQFVKELVLPPWSTLEDTTMEWVLWIIYFSGFAWIFGYVVMIPLGAGTLIYLQFLALWNFFEMLFGMGTFWEWLSGPWWRGNVSQPFIFSFNVTFTAIPILNFMSFLMGWWAVADYYGFNYVLFEGPVIPEEYYVERALEPGETAN